LSGLGLIVFAPVPDIPLCADRQSWGIVRSFLKGLLWKNRFLLSFAILAEAILPPMSGKWFKWTARRWSCVLNALVGRMTPAIRMPMNLRGNIDFNED